MARGRFISKAIIRDRSINELSDDTSRLAFTWLITLADCEGRTVGEPDLLKAALFPRRSDITPELIEGYTAEWLKAGFILWYYGDDGDRYIQFINFEKHQVGLRKNREAESEIQAPDNCRTVDGLTPEEIGLRLRVKLIKDEDEGNGYPPEISLYRRVTGFIPDVMNIDKVVADIQSAYERRGMNPAEFETYMRGVYHNWCGTSGKDGRKYQPTNSNWIEWAISGRYLDDNSDNAIKGEEGGYYA